MPLAIEEVVAGLTSRELHSGGMETTSLKASNNPLIVIDGVIFNGSINDINPHDIESIDLEEVLTTWHTIGLPDMHIIKDILKVMNIEFLDQG
jgi:hypothetical protein